MNLDFPTASLNGVNYVKICIKVRGTYKLFTKYLHILSIVVKSYNIHLIVLDNILLTRNNAYICFVLNLNTD